MIIAIDGPAGSGKSTVAKGVARQLGIRYLDSGALYRTIALVALESQVSLDDETAVTSLAEKTRITFGPFTDPVLSTSVFANDIDVSEAIRTPRIDDAVSIVARMPRVRTALIPIQRAIATDGDLVAEGRDMGTVVFPDAQVKVFLTASEQERSRRRHLEMLTRGEDVDEDTVRQGLARRDHADSTRASAPLIKAPEAVAVDTTGLTIEQVIDRICEIAEKRS